MSRTAERRKRIAEIEPLFKHETNHALIQLMDADARQKLGLTVFDADKVDEVESVAWETLEQCLDIAATEWGYEPEVPVQITLNLRDSYGRSNACDKRRPGWRRQYHGPRDAGPTINLNGLWVRTTLTSAHEYAHLRADPQIGNFTLREWQDAVRIVVIHEAAHIVEFSDVRVEGWAPELIVGSRLNGHGQRFQDIYRELRLQLGFVETKTRNLKKLEAARQERLPKCAGCEEPFERHRKDAKYCSAKCRMVASRKRKAEQESEKIIRHLPQDIIDLAAEVMTDEGTCEIVRGKEDWLNLVFNREFIAVFVNSNQMSTKWFQHHRQIIDGLCFKKGRIRFRDQHGNPTPNRESRPQAIVYKGPHPERFATVFGEALGFGMVVEGDQFKKHFDL